MWTFLFLFSSTLVLKYGTAAQRVVHQLASQGSTNQISKDDERLITSISSLATSRIYIYSNKISLTILEDILGKIQHHTKLTNEHEVQKSHRDTTKSFRLKVSP